MIYQSIASQTRSGCSGDPPYLDLLFEPSITGRMMASILVDLPDFEGKKEISGECVRTVSSGSRVLLLGVRSVHTLGRATNKRVSGPPSFQD